MKIGRGLVGAFVVLLLATSGSYGRKEKPKLGPTPKMGLPDLVVSIELKVVKLEGSGTEPDLVNYSVQPRWRVTNRGRTPAADVKGAILHRGQSSSRFGHFKNIRIRYLGVGESETGEPTALDNISYRADRPGRVAARIVIDPDNEIPEVNENNNQADAWYPPLQMPRDPKEPEPPR